MQKYRNGSSLTTTDPLKGALVKTKKFLVPGTGVGKAIAYALLKNSKHNEVTIADINFDRAYFVKNYLSLMLNDRDIPCTPIEFRVGETDASRLFKDFDVVVSALPAKHNVALAKAAISAGVNFCDLGGVLGVTNEMLDLKKTYPQIKISIIPDCGLMPWLGILLAKKLLCEMDKTHSIEILVGGIPQKPKPPVFYQKVFSPEGLKHVCYNPAPILVGGKIETVPPFFGYNQIKVEELKRFSKKFDGMVEIFVTAGASIAPWSFQKWGLDYFAEKTVRWPGYVKFFENIPQEQFESMVASHVNIPVSSENPDLVWMKVVAYGTKKGRTATRSVSLLDLFDQKTGLTAMERTTGFTTAIIAEMMAEGKIKTGINTPENAFDYLDINELLVRLGKFFSFR